MDGGTGPLRVTWAPAALEGPPHGELMPRG